MSFNLLASLRCLRRNFGLSAQASGVSRRQSTSQQKGHKILRSTCTYYSTFSMMMQRWTQKLFCPLPNFLGRPSMHCASSMKRSMISNMPANDGSIGDDCAGSGGIGLGVAPDNKECGESSAATTQSQTVTTTSTFIPNQPQHGPEASPSAAVIVGGLQESTSAEESHDADIHADRTPRRARRSRRSLAAARRMQSAASIRAMVREKSRRGILVSLDASTGELELSLSHLAIDEGSGVMGGGVGDGETNTNAAPAATSSRSHQQSRRGSMASVESWMEEVRRLQEQGQVSDEMLASILAGEANASAAASAAADARGPTLDEWNDSTSSLSITDAVTESCFSESGRPTTGTSPLSSTNYSTKDEGLRYYHRREREMPKMKALTPLPHLQPIRAPTRGQEQRREAKDALARAAIKRVLAEV